jgi:hypothetical protein
VGELVAEIWNDKALPAVPPAVAALVMTGASGAMLSVSVLPVVEVGIAEPSREAASPLESWITDEPSVAELETVKASVATTPSDIVLELIAQATHLEAPGVLLQLINAVVPLPAVTLTEVMSWAA